MNKERRAVLGNVIDQLASIEATRDDLVEKLQSMSESVEAARDSEQEAFDNMPEALQQGERGEAMSEAISAMEEALEQINTLKDALEEFDLDNAQSRLDDARGAA